MGSPLAGKPRWLRVAAPRSPGYLAVRQVIRQQQLNTVCESASCPNRGHCWGEGHAAFMILGGVCTRNCAFCDVESGRPGPVDPQEPERLAQAVAALGLTYVVITSVNRDDLDDGGAGQFAACLQRLRQSQPTPRIEVLTPDFRGSPGALARVLEVGPDVFNHNIETVPRLYPLVRPGAVYADSLDLLRRAALWTPQVGIKSGLILGMGETYEEILAVLKELREVGVAFLTMGQYLRPSLRHHPVANYWPPEFFVQLKSQALALGFLQVQSHPLARSSYMAGKT
ncbi:MAG: lipoyl synthase [Magnetococcus sp. DMHC-6]